MNDLFDQKQQFRNKIKYLKENQSLQKGKDRSKIIFNQIEQLDSFQHADTILCFWSMDYEVHTHSFIKKWESKKTFLLPVILGDDLKLRKFTGVKFLKKARSLQLLEPVGENYEIFNKIDLAIVPGLAFDKQNNRLGYGKGYYDRLLPKVSCNKIGVCFHFQYFEAIPHTPTDVKMDLVIHD